MVWRTALRMRQVWSVLLSKFRGVTCVTWRTKDLSCLKLLSDEKLHFPTSRAALIVDRKKSDFISLHDYLTLWPSFYIVNIIMSANILKMDDVCDLQCR